ncbi:unnamed protein product [Rhodiola kirilowii]
MMENEQKKLVDQGASDLSEEAEAIELVLFHVSECYVYLIPPRKSAASYRADEWDVNKWTWEGSLKVVSKREECIIRLEDKTTGELYAQAFLREGELHPVEPVIDSSRYFVLRIEENIDGRRRHAFIGIGFRERTEAYDFQAALHDHMKYLNKKKTAEEMEQQFQQSSSVDYSLKDGETIVINLKNKGDGVPKSNSLIKSMRRVSLDETSNKREPNLFIKPPPPPPASLSPTSTDQKSPRTNPPNLTLEEATSTNTTHNSIEEELKESQTPENETESEVPDDDFGDFQAAN